jgi:hypothetical protein
MLSIPPWKSSFSYPGRTAHQAVAECVDDVDQVARARVVPDCLDDQRPPGSTPNARSRPDMFLKRHGNEVTTKFGDVGRGI